MMVWVAIFTCAAGVSFCGLVGGKYELPTRQTNERDCVFAGELAVELLDTKGSYKDKIKVTCELKERNTK